MKIEEFGSAMGNDEFYVQLKEDSKSKSSIKQKLKDHKASFGTPYGSVKEISGCGSRSGIRPRPYSGRAALGSYVPLESRRWSQMKKHRQSSKNTRNGTLKLQLGIKSRDYTNRAGKNKLKGKKMIFTRGFLTRRSKDLERKNSLCKKKNLICAVTKPNFGNAVQIRSVLDYINSEDLGYNFSCGPGIPILNTLKSPVLCQIIKFNPKLVSSPKVELKPDQLLNRKLSRSAYKTAPTQKSKGVSTYRPLHSVKRSHTVHASRTSSHCENQHPELFDLWGKYLRHIINKQIGSRLEYLRLVQQSIKQETEHSLHDKFNDDTTTSRILSRETSTQSDSLRFLSQTISDSDQTHYSSLCNI